MFDEHIKAFVQFHTEASSVPCYSNSFIRSLYNHLLSASSEHKVLLTHV